MKYALVFLGFLGLVGCGAGGGGGGGGASSNSGPRLVVFGDETSAGVGATTSWGAIVAQSMGRTLLNKSCDNSQGTSGTCVISGVTNQTYFTSAGIQASDVVIIMPGFNDVRYYGNTIVYGGGIDNFFGFFLSEIIATGATVYVVSPIRMMAGAYSLFSPLNLGTDPLMLGYASYLQGKVTAAASPKVKFIDVEASFNPIVANFNADSQFPSNAGHASIAALIEAGL